ncbi:MAG TPA: hypothetical protein VFK02_13550 [Kofleriaceae bacterium]|nr:hypothetical protein [Kofleriaceae bacterium]
MIGIQLDLFGDRYLQLEAPGYAAPEVLVPDGPQLELFADRHLRLERARRALSEARASDAVHELRDLLHRYPGDQVIGAELELARDVERRINGIEAAPPGERPCLLVALARSVTADLQAALLRRAAAELCRSDPAALLDGKSASVLLLQAGDREGARIAAEAAASASGRSRFLAYLADVEVQCNLRDRARERYREALALDPHDVDWEEIRDDDVRSLPDIARTEFELEEAVAWSAAVGVVLGVLPPGRAPSISDAGAAAPLDRMRRFLSALARDRSQAGRPVGGAVLDARREMRALAPQLLAAYLESK